MVPTVLSPMAEERKQICPVVILAKQLKSSARGPLGVIRKFLKPSLSGGHLQCSSGRAVSRDFRIVLIWRRWRDSGSNASYILVGALNEALKSHDKLRLYYEVAADFSAIEPGAVWEDFKTGIKHLTRWERMTVVTDVDWIKHAIRFFNFLMPEELRIFPLSQAAQARAWIAAE